jgi:Skp family chaperone for outer membrane proteins
MKTLLVFVLLIAITFSLFSDDSAVVKLTEKNFKKLVLESDEFWLV